jgi:hypothetical protein
MLEEPLRLKVLMIMAIKTQLAQTNSSDFFFELQNHHAATCFVASSSRSNKSSSQNDSLRSQPAHLL